MPWRRQYPAKVRYRVRRITAREDLAVVEVSASYNDGPWQYGVQLLEFRERIYVMEGCWTLRALSAYPSSVGWQCYRW
jgi:hypothetical protein